MIFIYTACYQQKVERNIRNFKSANYVINYQFSRMMEFGNVGKLHKIDQVSSNPSLSFMLREDFT